MLISGFPGVGKTRASQIFKTMIDLDSMQYAVYEQRKISILLYL